MNDSIAVSCNYCQIDVIVSGLITDAVLF